MRTTNQDDFRFFTEEIERYVENVHFLNHGISMDIINELESELSMILPTEYKYFLQLYNGGEIFCPGTVLAEVYHETLGERKNGIYYLNDAFKEEKRMPSMPDNFLIIADMNYGDNICIMLNKDDVEKSTLVQWSPDDMDVSRGWTSLKEWLISALSEGSALVDYNGEERELDF